MKVMKYYTLNNLNEVDDNNEINNPDSIKLVQGMILSSDATYENNEGTGGLLRLP